MTQILLAIIISVLTILLVITGIQVIRILKEVRLMLTKINRMLEDATQVTHSVAQPIVNLSSLVESLRGGAKLRTWIKRLTDVAEPENGMKMELPEGEEKGLSYIEQLQEKGREAAQKFFHKNGKSLG